MLNRSLQVQIRLTASHLGNFQFKICPHNNPTVPVTQECLDQHRLNLAGTDEHHFYPKETGYYDIDLQLPPDMVCSQCILQWHYTAGNRSNHSIQKWCTMTINARITCNTYFLTQGTGFLRKWVFWKLTNDFIFVWRVHVLLVNGL